MLVKRMCQGPSCTEHLSIIHNIQQVARVLFSKNHKIYEQGIFILKIPYLQEFFEKNSKNFWNFFWIPKKVDICTVLM
jgi:hypothetical protein